MIVARVLISNLKIQHAEFIDSQIQAWPLVSGYKALSITDRENFQQDEMPR